jgi:hypothetical protein
MPDKEFLDQAKRILKQVPGIQSLNRIRQKIIRIRELSSLVRKNKIVVFCLESTMANNSVTARTMTQEITKEWLDLYGVMHLRRKTAVTIDAPAGASLLYAPQALLRIPCSHEDYLRLVRHETRKAIRLAHRQGYEFSEFCWNDYLGDIFEINTSKELRQSEPMHGWYTEPVQPRYHSSEELRYQKYYGAFKDGRLCAYFHYWICGDFGVGKHFIGHAQHLKNGIMNGLISYTVQECIRNSELQWLHYGLYNEGPLGLFKKHAGCQPYTILLDLHDDQNLLKYSERTVKTLWRI